MLMNNPPHPGKHVRMNCLNPSGMTVTTAAKSLGFTRQALNNVINEKSSISSEMALRFEKNRLEYNGSLVAPADALRPGAGKSAGSRYRCTCSSRTGMTY
jgi:addiction module HigA family antidote